MLPRHLWVLVVSTTAALAAATPTHSTRATVCNGRAEYCSRLYSNVTYVGSHDSFAFSSDPLALARDQEVNITAQLQLGVRLLQAQGHMNGNVLHFCHTSCSLFDGGTVLNYLKAVKRFLDENPNEVLTLLFTNPEGLSPRTIWKPIFDAAGISNMTYVPPSLPMKQSDWPTLGNMIDSGTRVIVFLDSQADGPQPVNFILPDLHLGNTLLCHERLIPCSVNRIHGPLATEDHIYLINHSLNINIIPIGSGVIIPDPLEAVTTNGVTSILAHANGCTPLGGNRAPSFVLLDFVNLGAGFQAAEILNGINL
ncbi:transcription factor IIIB 60 kDa subunit [Favolaschia claudopus]|uniref:Transcription factor IIIB 60 kDa subunit n=1 Tax=Favolaschia claudopus TaxID=2862362 RepID=A0AAW0CEN3_9AGAR